MVTTRFPIPEIALQLGDIVVIIGPVATGKTELAVAFAEQATRLGTRGVVQDDAEIVDGKEFIKTLMRVIERGAVVIVTLNHSVPPSLAMTADHIIQTAKDTPPLVVKTKRKMS